tara:strand:+ start:221 stop:742 length:522 start_codon:yes stop_codon:yes gene_type:complete
MPIQRAKPKFTDVKNVSIAASTLPTGSVVQTVTGANPGSNDTEVTKSGAYAATGFYVDITPTSTSNIIVVFGRAMGGTSYSDDGSYMELFRKIGSGTAATTNSTEAWLGTDYHNNFACMQVPILFYDSTHNTTSTIRYELYLKSHSSYNSYMNKAAVYATQGRTHLIAQEIKG